MFPLQPEAADARQRWVEAVRIRTGLMGGELNREISDAILASQARSRIGGIDPALDRMRVQDEQYYGEYVEANRSFLEAADRIVENVGKPMDMTHSMIQLFTPHGMLVKSCGDAGILKKAERINNVPGGICSEQAVGTTGVGLALELGKPSLVIGREHYCEMFQDWTCLAYPIMDPGSKQVAGVLNITGRQEAFTPHTIGLIQYGVFSIERLLHARNVQRDCLLLKMLIRETRAHHPVMIVNRFGEVLHSTDHFPSLPGMADLKPLISLHDPEVELQLSFHDDREIRLASKQVWRERQFLGWWIQAHPVPKYSAKAAIKPHVTFDRLIGRSAPFHTAVDVGRKAAASHATVLLLGDTGTGKELFARSIHNESPRKAKPFVAINCGAVPRELVGSELFGYEEGAFSGAKKGGEKGKFELAQGGTLFLDEVGELPLEHQVYLLRVLQEKTLRRIGGTKEITLDVRVIAATNGDLKQMVEQKCFRRDLYFRLNIIALHLPSLAERGSRDIALLADYFLDMYNEQENKAVSLAAEVYEALAAYAWPGNVRELENVICRFVVLADGHAVTGDDLPPELQQHRRGNDPAVHGSNNQAVHG